MTSAGLPVVPPSAGARLRRDWPFLVAAGLVTAVALLLLWFAGRTLLLVGAAILVATILHAASAGLARLTGLGRGWCLGIVCVVVLVIVVAVTWIAVPEIARQAGDLANRIREAWSAFSRRVDDFALGQQALQQIEGQSQGGGGGGSSEIGQTVQQVFGFAAATANGIAEFGIILALGLYLAIDPELYMRGMLRLLPIRKRHRAEEILRAIGSTLRSWLLGQLVAMTMIGVATGIGLWLLGIPQALVLGIVAGLLDFVPTVGPIVAAVPGLLAAASVDGRHVLYALIIYVVVQAAENNLIVPIVQRRAVDLPPAVTMVALVVMGLVGGVLGLLLAVPLAAALTVGIRMAYIEDVLGDRID
jgi:predicted PurR-regulated permease PerM